MRYDTMTSQQVRSLHEKTDGHRPRSMVTLDSVGLERELRAKVRGEVRFDAGSQAIYSTDASNYRQVPIGVVIPKDADDVVATVATCRDYGAPIVNRGGGTSTTVVNMVR